MGQPPASLWLIEGTQQHSGQALLKQSLDLRRAIGDRNGIAWSILNLTCVALAQHDYLAYERSAREALASMREIRSVKGVVQALFNLAQAVFLKVIHDQQTREALERFCLCVRQETPMRGLLQTWRTFLARFTNFSARKSEATSPCCDREEAGTVS